MAIAAVDSGGGSRNLPGFGLALGLNRPNPFRGSTTINFVISGSIGTQHVTLRVMDVSGRLVRTLLDKDLAVGAHQATWDGRRTDGRDVVTGVYFYRLEARGQGVTRPMVFVR